jgi:hypothetical protein
MGGSPARRSEAPSGSCSSAAVAATPLAGRALSLMALPTKIKAPNNTNAENRVLIISYRFHSEA